MEIVYNSNKNIPEAIVENSQDKDGYKSKNNNKYIKDSQELIDFIAASPSPYHVVDNIKSILSDIGMTELDEKDKWNLKAGHGYYVVRGMSSIIAFTMPAVREGVDGLNYKGYNIVASHSDSPSFKVKENPEMPQSDHYISLNVEKYGGMIMSTWLDRPLSIAGRAVTVNDTEVKEYLINADKDLVVIPNLAIHMDRTINDGYSFNAQKDMIPLFGDERARNQFDAYIRSLISDNSSDDDSKKALENAVSDNVSADNSEEDNNMEKIYIGSSEIATELFLYNREKGTIWGYNNEYISAPRLDDIQCAYSSVKAFADTYVSVADNVSTSTNMKNLFEKNVGNTDVSSCVNVCCIFNNEEVGSGTRQGADSTFLSDVLERISIVAGKDREEYIMALASSFMISADNAHAVHPNHQDKADPTNRPYMNGGIVIKFNGNQKYTTDATSYAIFKKICKDAGVPYQTYANRSDIAGGSTLGNISGSHVSVNTVDIGLAQLAMHSAYETAGVKDTTYMITALKQFYSGRLL